MYTFTANINDTTAPTISISPALPFSFAVDFTALVNPTDTVASRSSLAIYTNMSITSTSNIGLVVTANTANTMNSGDDSAVWVSVTTTAGFQFSRMVRFVASDASSFGGISIG